jgi:hypothetical protein
MIRFRSRSDSPSCPAGWEITRALSQPETSADVLRHVRDCPTCTQLATELRAVISAAAEMPPVAPLSQAAHERINRALSAVSETRAPRLGFRGRAGRRRGRARGLAHCCASSGTFSGYTATGRPHVSGEDPHVRRGQVPPTIAAA